VSIPGVFLRGIEKQAQLCSGTFNNQRSQSDETRCDCLSENKIIYEAATQISWKGLVFFEQSKLCVNLI